MHTVEIKKLEPGMITAAAVTTKHGQLIVDAHKMLTTQMITHMDFYGITGAMIVDGELSTAAIESLVAERHAVDTYSQKIIQSKEYKEFKEKYEKKVVFLENSLNDFITKNIPFDKNALIACTMDLFVKHTTTISMFDMLHNTRKITDSTYAHCMNVAIISRMIGMWLEYNKEALDTLTLGGLLHDIGKCKIPHAIINKPGKLTAEEYEMIKKHPSLGYDMLKDQNVAIQVKQIALFHHERCDGSGYPLALKGDAIDDYSNIIAIADVYDAMTSDRCYRNGVCPFEVIASFERDGLGKYKPQFIMSFLEHIANTYINNNVLLSDGTTGKIVLINKQHLTRPVIQTTNNKFINLDKRLDLYVQAII